MAEALSSLNINDWKEYYRLRMNTPKPELIGHFITSWNKSELFKNNFNSLKYLNRKLDLNVNKIHEKFQGKKVFEKINSLSNHEFNCFANYLNSISFENYEIITTRNVLSTIMCTPFDINNEQFEWKLQATFKNNKIHLVLPDIQSNFTKFNDVLQRYLFCKQPEIYYKDYTTIFDEIFYEMYELNLSGINVCYADVIPGVNSESKVSNLEELKSSDHIYCDVVEHETLIRNIDSYNPKWWSNSKLINAKQCFIGIYDCNKNCFKEILNFSTEKFNDCTKYENLWSPLASWNFLDIFIRFVKSEVDRVTNIELKNKCTWEFKCNVDNNHSIVCEAYFIEYSNVTNKYVRCVVGTDSVYSTKQL